MALPPKPLSSSPASSFYAFQLVPVPTPRPVFPNLNSQKPPTLIICKSAHTATPGSPVSTPEPDESGPSAPTRGDIFLRRHWSAAASATILEEIKKTKKKDKAAKISSVFNVPSCYGCGASLQSLEIDAPGYVDTETYNLKKKHRQLKTILCGRCKLLSHGHMITAVGGNGGYPGGKPFVTAEELRAKLSHLRHGKALVVKLVDIVDFNGSFLSRIRDLVGANPIILVITKVDLLPKGTDLNCVGDWVVEATLKKKLTVLSVHLTSSKSLVGIAGVVSEIQKEKKGRDVYILGAANVGKSAFINALLKMLSYKNPEASAARKYKPVQSAVPGTTLGPIQIKAFSGGGNLFDTPGLHLHHRQAAVIHSQDLPVLAPQSRLRGHSFPNPNLVLDSPLSEGSISNGLAGLSIFWGGLVRIDVTKVLPETRLTFYGPKALRLHVVPTEKADEFYQKGVGTLLMPPCGKPNTERWMGLNTKRELRIQYHDIERPACDVAISGLGWISVEPFTSKSSEALPPPSPVEGGVVGEIGLVVHVPKPVEIFVRPPLPVGSEGGHWYEYRELDEIEQEIRPQWYF